MIEQLKSTLQDLSDEEKAKIMMRFFKTGKGEYGEGDIFLGISVPNQRLIAKEFYQQVSLNDIKNLLNSNIHEYRLTALLMLVSKYEKSKDELVRKEIIDFYLAQTSQINNWDLVDTSCYKILGHYCFHQKREELLFELANSEDLWEKRIAIVSTMYFIKQKSFSIVPEIVLKNLNHSHDLMHKANGWMLREMGKMDEEKLIEFLDEYTLQMPRTTLRYALEKIDPILKDYYMKLK
ncbi:DNA alkylation repair protein [Empedobacter falsenii]|uniref:DNA alkylation repair protein n=1 Tax=Empedobacter TaxID=59734 RepID=UPI000E88EAAB|nr:MULTISPECIES: DNA alkylation repair protein [Empedobacter]MDH1882932.1 DNA alkylation repair protein [Empedobacter sp. GD03797]MDM1040793.1 DNA alkylation repair protein [Empedobacter brevis]MDM1134374.1 DNA alkylation repair protein [Empedobacter sp. R750]HAR74486.1 DNA alkylation repair protein [Flavobacteriaceae bacterium]